MEISRSLITFAYIAEQFERTGDIAQGLLPLFAPIIAQRAGQRFDPAQFAEDVLNMFDISMHPYVAEEFAPRLASAGYLKEEVKKDNNVIYQNQSVATAEAPVSESRLHKLLNMYVEYANEHLKRIDQSLDEETLKQSFLDQLIEMDFLGLILKPDRSFLKKSTLTLKSAENGQTEEDSIDLYLSYLAASFILHVRDTSERDFELLVSVCSGALVAEVVLSLQNPPTTTDAFQNLTIILDGPLIMDALGLGHDDQGEYARTLIQQLKNVGAAVKTFSHIIEEVEGAIRTPLTNYERGQDVYGPLGRKLLQSPAFPAYLRTMLKTLTEDIEKLGVTTYEFSDIDRHKLRVNFTQALEGELADSIGYYLHAESKQRDARTVADVLRIRGPKQVSTVKTAEIIFVTRNTRLASMSRKFLQRRNLVSETYFPPCITDRQLAGIMWITSGGGGSKLSRQRLIANCTAAIRPRRDVITRMHSFLADLDDQMAARFDALMTNERAENFLMDRTLGDFRLITQENVEEIYQEVEAIAAERVAKEKDAEIEKLKSDHLDEIERVRARGTEAVEAASTETLEIQHRLRLEEERVRDRDKKIEALASELRDLRNAELVQEKAIVASCVESGKRAASGARRLIAFGIFIFAVAGGVLAEFLPSAVKDIHEDLTAMVIIGLILVSAGFAVLNYYAFPTRAMERFVRNKRRLAFFEQVKNIGAEEIVDKYEIEWKTGAINEKDKAVDGHGND